MKFVQDVNNPLVPEPCIQNAAVIRGSMPPNWNDISGDVQTVEIHPPPSKLTPGQTITVASKITGERASFTILAIKGDMLYCRCDGDKSYYAIPICGVLDGNARWFSHQKNVEMEKLRVRSANECIDVSEYISRVDKAPPVCKLSLSQKISCRFGNEIKTFIIIAKEGEMLVCKGEIGKQKYLIPVWGVCDGDARWFKQQRKAEERFEREKLRLQQKAAVANASQRNKRSPQDYVEQIARNRKVAAKRALLRQEELNRYAVLTSMLERQSVDYSSKAKGRTYLISADGVVVGLTKSVHECVDDDNAHIVRSESSEIDTWKGFGVARPESDGRFGGIIGEDWSE